MKRGNSAGSPPENKLRSVPPARGVGLSAELLPNTNSSTKNTQKDKRTAKPAVSTKGSREASKRLKWK